MRQAQLFFKAMPEYFLLSTICHDRGLAEVVDVFQQHKIHEREDGGYCMKKVIKVGVLNKQEQLVGHTNHSTDDADHIEEFERGIIRNLVFTDDDIAALEKGEKLSD